MFNFFYIILVAFPFANIYAMDWQGKELIPQAIDGSLYRYYKGTEITAETICKLADPMPKDIQNYFDEWTEEKRNLLDRVILPNSKVDLGRKNDGRYTAEFQSLIKNFGFINESKLNAALPLMIVDKMYYFKFAGPLRRAYNLQATLNHDRSLKQSDEIKTFQTVGQLPTVWRLNEFCQKENITTIELAQTYLGLISYRSKSQVDDYSTVLVQKKMEGYKALYNQPDKLGTISQKAIDDLVHLIRVGPVYDINANLLYNPETQKLGLCDFESDWNQPAQYFFNKNEKTIAKTITSSIIGLYQLAQEGGNKGQSESAEAYKNKLDHSFYSNVQLLRKLNPEQIREIQDAGEAATDAIYNIC